MRPVVLVVAIGAASSLFGARALAQQADSRVPEPDARKPAPSDATEPPATSTIIACVGDGETCNSKLALGGYLHQSAFDDSTRAQSGTVVIWVAPAGCADPEEAKGKPECAPAATRAKIGSIVESLQVDGHDYSEVVTVAGSAGEPVTRVVLKIDDLAGSLKWDPGHTAVIRVSYSERGVKRWVAFSFIYGWAWTSPDPDLALFNPVGFWFPIGLLGLGKNDTAGTATDGPVRVAAMPIGLALGTQFRSWSSSFYLGASWFVAPSVLGPSSSGVAQSAYLGIATGPLLTLDGKVTVGGARNCFTGAGTYNGCGWFLVVGSPLLSK